MEMNTPGLLCLPPSERKEEHEIEGVSIICNELLENTEEGFLIHKERKAPQEVDGNNVVSILELKKESEKQEQHIEREERPDTEDEVEIDPDFKKKIGSGAFGVVFLVKSPSPESKNIAMKEILKTDKNADEVENEISLHKQLDHIHVVKFLKYEIITVGQREKYNIYLEYVPSSLATFLSKHAYRREESYVLFFLRQLVDGVRYLHSQRVVHCDIKCDNILVDENETLKICDFGLAHDLQNGNIMSWRGTPNFAAPEVCRPPKEGFGRSADVWSIGCACLEMLTGYAPFYELESLVIIFQMGYGILKIDEKLQDRFSPECKQLMLSCWIREASERPAIEELSDLPFLNGKSVSDEDSDEEESEEEEDWDDLTPPTSLNEEADIDYLSYQPQNDMVLLQKTCVTEEMQTTFVCYDFRIKREEPFEDEGNYEQEEDYEQEEEEEEMSQ